MTSLKAQVLWDNIKKGDLSGVVNILENGNINFEERDENGQTFLMVACEKGELNIVRELLENDVGVNAVDNDNWSALLCAAKEGHLEIVIELLERSANIEHRDMCGWTALMWACYKGKTMVVQELLDRGANPNIKAEHNMTCLTWASGRGYTEIVKLLLQKGAKVNTADKYGTTPLIWSCRKGYTEIVEALLNEGASVDVAGMNSWTALLVATRGGFVDVVHLLLDHDPNVNAVDKDGFTALTIACKEGNVEIVHELLAKGAYVNLADRAGDTILIHGVKGGHVEVVRALMNKYADVDVEGSEGKTVLYWAVEKGHNEIVRLLLDSDPDLEICTKDGDTPLLRAVRNRNETCVRLLLDKGAKVSAFDKRGDTALHISLRARSKRITELLLRNPKNGRLLYKPNKASETPYNIDAYYQKGILTQIFGHRNLNASDGENLLGYEIYSSALADILSEPALSTPITIGLYAKWGSGKSFLLSKLQGEMRSFTEDSSEEHFTFNWGLFLILLLINDIIGLTLSLTVQWEVGFGVGLGLFLFEYVFFGVIWISARKFDMSVASVLSQALGRKLRVFTLLLKVLFCNANHHHTIHNNNVVPTVKFLFSESTRLTSVGGEKALAAMIATLSDSIEREYGFLVTRLFRVFKPTTNKHYKSKFKTVCCIPYFVIVLIVILCLCVGITLLVVFGITDNTPVNAAMLTFACVIGLSFISNIYTWGQVLHALLITQRNRILQAADQIDSLKMDGLMQQLKYEVDLMSKLVTCIDTFTRTNTRLVVIVDGLDSCEQDKVLQVLDIIKMLFSDDNSPFITILAVDPHIIIKGIEHNLKSAFQDSNVNGFDYLRNVVHLPFYLQSQGIRIQKQGLIKSASSHEFGSHSGESPGKGHRAFQHQDSLMSSYSESKYRKNKHARRQESFAASHSTFDLTHTLTKNDYFSDVNPKSMRRLMNIVAVTGRLLRAYNIDFNWYRLAAWVNIIEQWPYRVSWIILYFEENDAIDVDSSLLSIYEIIVQKIPISKEIEPLLEIDRNVRKLEAFLASKSANAPMLNVADLKKFLPCTINLDPYLRKLIREQRNANVLQGEFAMNYPSSPPGSGLSPHHQISYMRDVNQGLAFSNFGTPRMQTKYTAGSMYGRPMMQYSPVAMMPQMSYQGILSPPPNHLLPNGGLYSTMKTSPFQGLLKEHQDGNLSQMTCRSVCDMLTKIDGISHTFLSEYQKSFEENNITGRVLATCDLDELGKVLQMKFGDWQLLKATIMSLREEEMKNVFSGERKEDNLRKNNLGSRKSVHIKSTPSTNSASSFDDSISPHSRSQQPELPRQASCDSVKLEQVLQNEYIDTAAQFDPIEEEEEEPSPRMKREDSVVCQLQYETGLLREAMQSFTESNLEGEESDENDVILENESHRRLPVQFSLSSHYENASEKSEPASPVSSQSFKLNETSSALPEDSAAQDTYPLLPTTSLGRVVFSDEPSDSVKNVGYRDYDGKKPVRQYMKKSSSTGSGGFRNIEEEPWARQHSTSLSDSFSVINEAKEGTESSRSLEESIKEFMASQSGNDSKTSIHMVSMSDNLSHNSEDCV